MSSFTGPRGDSQRMPTPAPFLRSENSKLFAARPTSRKTAPHHLPVTRSWYSMLPVIIFVAPVSSPFSSRGEIDS